jgi:hypothetical protein
MQLPPVAETFIRENLSLLVGLYGLVTILFAVILVLLFSRLGRLTRLTRRLTQGTSGGNIEEILHGYLDHVQGIDQRMKSLEGMTDRLTETQRRCLQRVGIVRYDAFEDVGGQMSFSIALTDADRNGAVISSVYSRTDVRVYTKALQNGRANQPLSVEEQRALSAAENAMVREVLEGV